MLELAVAGPRLLPAIPLQQSQTPRLHPERVTHLRLSGRLLARSPSMWFTIVCFSQFSEGGGSRKALATSRWTLRVC